MSHSRPKSDVKQSIYAYHKRGAPIQPKPAPKDPNRYYIPLRIPVY